MDTDKVAQSLKPVTPKLLRELGFEEKECKRGKTNGYWHMDLGDEQNRVSYNTIHQKVYYHRLIGGNRIYVSGKILSAWDLVNFLNDIQLIAHRFKKSL